jgi:hypothetical protein
MHDHDRYSIASAAATRLEENAPNALFSGARMLSIFCIKHIGGSRTVASGPAHTGTACKRALIVPFKSTLTVSVHVQAGLMLAMSAAARSVLSEWRQG